MLRPFQNRKIRILKAKRPDWRARTGFAVRQGLGHDEPWPRSRFPSRWARVSDAIRATVRARIADAQAAQLAKR